MTKYTDRLMSRACVAAMAAFAPKEAVSTLPAFAERIDADAGGGDSGGTDRPPIDGMSAEEQAQFEAMTRGEGGAAAGEAPPAGDADGPGDGDGLDGDGDGDIDPPEPAAPREGDAPAPAADGERPAPRTVPYGKYQRELAKAQTARDDLQTQLDSARGETKKEREERLRLDERTKMLLDAISRKPAPAAADAPPADPEPDKDADPIAHLEWRNRRLEKTVGDLQSGQTRQRELTAAETEERGIYTALESDINRTTAADPTFTDAFVHLRESRFQELGFIYAGIDINDKAAVDAALSPADQSKLADNIQRSFYNEQILVARQALAAEKSPAAVIRNLAKARGWVPKAAPAANGGEAPPPAARNGSAAPRAPVAPRAPAAAPSVREQLDAVRDNLDASRSLSDAGGSPGGQMTPQRIADMTPAEFERYYDSVPKDQFDRMMGKVEQ